MPATPGGTAAGRQRLRRFLKERLEGPAEHRSEPRSPETAHASGLSPYLHFGHISIEEVVNGVFTTTETGAPTSCASTTGVKRESLFCESPPLRPPVAPRVRWRRAGFTARAVTRAIPFVNMTMSRDPQHYASQNRTRTPATA